MKSLVFAAAAAAGVLSLAAPAFAADPTPSPHARELAQRLVDDLGLDSTLHAVVDAAAPKIVERFTKGRDHTPADDKAVADAYKAALGDILPEYERVFVDIYADSMSEEDLQSALDFYEGPAGKKFTEETNQLSARLSVLISDIIPKLDSAMTREFCKRAADSKIAARECAAGSRSKS